MDEQTLREQLRRLAIWKDGDQRAPHKPLLLIWAVARVMRGESRLAEYQEIADELIPLLDRFGPARARQQPAQPFWRLRKDGSFWEVPQAPAILAAGGEGGSGNPRVPLLREFGAQGGFTQVAASLLLEDPKLATELVAELLAEHFPETLHEEILDSVGMPWVQLRSAPRRGDFRRTILRIYEHRCAICGFDGKLEHADVCLDAAHVHWHNHAGPDTPDNGLALCALHHRAFDHGAIGIDERRRILVSQHVHGGEAVTEQLIRYTGQPLHAPVAGEPPVNLIHASWHRKQVFKLPARAA